MIDKKQIKKILIFKLCCLGDIVLLTPTINSLKKNFPDSHISMIVCSWVEGLIKYLPNVDSIIINDDLYKESFWEKATGAIKLIFSLRKHSFDLVFLGHRNSAFGLILKLSGIRYRLGFCGTKFLNYCEPFEEKIYEANRYLKVLNSIGINFEESPLELIQKNPVKNIKEQFKIDNNKFIIGIFPFGGYNPGTIMDIKQWEIKNYFYLVKIISEKYPDTIIILFEGNQPDEKIIEKNFSSNVLKLKIEFDLISICNVLVSSDTGAMHIAAGFKVSTLSLFGPTDPNLLAPHNFEFEKNIIHNVIWKKPECSPCYTTQTAIQTNNKKYWHNGNFICHTGTHICMKEISVEEVYNNLCEMINQIKK